MTMRATPSPSEEVERLREENTRLVALLENNGIEWRLQPKPEQLAATPATIEPSPLSLPLGAFRFKEIIFASFGIASRDKFFA